MKSAMFGRRIGLSPRESFRGSDLSDLVAVATVAEDGAKPIAEGGLISATRPEVTFRLVALWVDRALRSSMSKLVVEGAIIFNNYLNEARPLN